MNGSALIFTRELPGGGFVAVEAVEEREARCAARLLVERRTDPRRRFGHAPPIIAEASGERGRVLAELCAIANSNVEVAQRIRQWERRRDPEHH